MEYDGLGCAYVSCQMGAGGVLSRDGCSMKRQAEAYSLSLDIALALMLQLDCTDREKVVKLERNIQELLAIVRNELSRMPAI